MLISEFIQNLINKQINIEVVNGQLKILGDKNNITSSVLSEIKDKKIEIIDFLTNGKENYNDIKCVEKRDYYSLSSAQTRLYFLQTMDLASTVYNIFGMFYLGSAISYEKVRYALEILVNRHESLRTGFMLKDGLPVQYVCQTVNFEIEKFYVDSINNSYIKESFSRPFNLMHAPLIRFALVEENNNDVSLMIDMHHIICDGVSYKILKNEFTTLYSGGQLSPLKLQYKDFVSWQNNSEQKYRIKLQEEYWVEVFQGKIPALNLPVDYTRPAVLSDHGSSVVFKLTKEESRKIKYVAEIAGVTSYISFLSVYLIFLFKLTDLNKIVIGTPVANRRHSDLENIVGMFVNTLAIPYLITNEITLKEFLNEIKKTFLDALDNQDYQFEDLVNKLLIERDVSRNPIFDVTFNYDVNEADSDGSDFIDSFPREHTKTSSKFDLSLNVTDFGDQFLVSMSYCSALFKLATINYFEKYIREIVSQLHDCINKPLLSIELLGRKEKWQILQHFNNTSTYWPSTVTIIELFESQVKATPYDVAIRFENKKLTYLELNQFSNKLAHYLRENHEIKPNDLIGIELKRSEWMVMAILGVLKSGAGYVPIDLDYPKSRRSFLYLDSNCKVLIDDNELEKFKYVEAGYSSFNPTLTNVPSDLAYVIYTSGTTGNPKGVMIEHKNLNYFFNYVLKNHKERDKPIILPFIASNAFDISIFQIFTPLLSGGSIIVVGNENLRNLESFTSILKDVTALDTVPAVYNAVVNYILENNLSDSFNHIKELFIGGDSIPDGLLNKLTMIFTSAIITVMYGPTEGTIFCTHWVYNLGAINERSKGNLIGHPIANNRIYILDSNQDQLRPIGVSGEICIGGGGVARGYLNRPELTKGKFVPDPFNVGERMYLTGDLGRWLPEGNIEFLGRKDSQVKIRGYRIELGEIESALISYEKIGDAVVISRITADSEIELFAYIISKEQISRIELLTYLSNILPSYMLPSHFIQLEKFPLTSNGKIDKNALSTSENKKIVSGVEYVAAKNETEKKLLQIWATLLKLDIEKISINDNFFNLGGQSLSILRMFSMIKKQFNSRISLMHIYKFPVIKNIALAIDSDLYTSNNFNYFNAEEKPKIFCFPPFIADGYCYKQLADSIQDYCFCCFNYVKSDDVIHSFVDQLTNLQKDSPYILLGYSAGAKILFPIAKELERRGRIVSKIISIDGYWGDYSVISDGLEISNMFDGYIEELGLQSAKQELYQRISDYDQFVRAIQFDGKLNSEIHFLLSQGWENIESEEHILSEVEQLTQKLKKHTEKRCLIHRGAGLHSKMIDDEFAVVNSVILKEILTN